MGLLCDPEHPALAKFPTEMHTNWQWWDVLRPSRVLNLDGMQPQPTPIVRMIDSFVGNRTLSVVCEARLSNGRILITSLDLTSNLEDRHAARQRHEENRDEKMPQHRRSQAGQKRPDDGV